MHNTLRKNDDDRRDEKSRNPLLLLRQVLLVSRFNIYPQSKVSQTVFPNKSKSYLFFQLTQGVLLDQVTVT